MSEKKNGKKRAIDDDTTNHDIKEKKQKLDKPLVINKLKNNDDSNGDNNDSNNHCDKSNNSNEKTNERDDVDNSNPSINNNKLSHEINDKINDCNKDKIIVLSKKQKIDDDFKRVGTCSYKKDKKLYLASEKDLIDIQNTIKQYRLDINKEHGKLLSKKGEKNVAGQIKCPKCSEEEPTFYRSSGYMKKHIIIVHKQCKPYGCCFDKKCSEKFFDFG